MVAIVRSMECASVLIFFFFFFQLVWSLGFMV